MVVRQDVAVTSEPGLREYLNALDAATLVDLLLEQAERDPELRASLLDRAERHAAARLGNGRITAVLDTVRRLLDAGTSADVTPLARRAVEGILGALERGEARVQQLDEALSLCARASRAHPPEPVELASWLVRVALAEPVRPTVPLHDFAAALGERGLAHMKSTVDKKAAGKGPRAQAARQLREQLAEVSGDVDTLVAILSAQLPRPEVGLRIVRALRDAGRHTEAIAHAAKMLHPPTPQDEAIAECRDDIERLIAGRDAASYRQAAKRLRELRSLHRDAGSSDEFTGYLSRLADTHRRKTRLLAEIRNARIALPKQRRPAGESMRT
jgi:hypothetical protein